MLCFMALYGVDVDEAFQMSITIKKHTSIFGVCVFRVSFFSMRERKKNNFGKNIWHTTNLVFC